MTKIQKVIVCAIFLILSFSLVFSRKNDYYWRDYTGEIPDDAVPGGRDKHGQSTYIAQVYIPNYGIIPTRLHLRQKSVAAFSHGIHTSAKFIKILCSEQPEKFSWVPTTALTLHLEGIGKHLVVGGTESGKLLNIGQVSYQGEVILGKICSFNIGNALMYFPYSDDEIRAASYEVLVYEDNPISRLFPRSLIIIK